ncbi:helix-turn-helix domain-containing protein [Gracilibacillus dipsosauri]|nr:helix-turn-helix domain-containing protein [Gracilibacillus dipsosauri]
MDNSKWKKLLHPVRMEIIQTLAGGKELTASQLASLLPNVPHATLYRHIKYLHDIGLIIVKKEIPKRGTMERVYSLAKGADSIAPNDLKSLSKEEHLDLFTTFISNTVQDFGNYLEQGNHDFLADGVSYRQGIYYMSDDEFKEFVYELKKVYQKYQSNEPTENRKKRKITTVMIPMKGEG